MVIEKSNTLNENLNNIRLLVSDFGHARTLGSEWIGNVINPSHARLYYILDGDPFIIDVNGRSALEVGRCYLLPAGYSFSHSCDTGMEQLFFHINLLDANGVDLLKSCTAPISYVPEPEKLDEIRLLTGREDTLGALLLRRELYDSLFTLLECGGIKLESVSYSSCVRLAVEYIRTHLSMQLGVAELAAHAFVSVSTLSKKFRTEVGMTIGSYIDEKVMLEAERLLCKNELTVLEISEHFGYCDQFYFSRRFKARFGETPQKYRKDKPI